MKYLKFFMDIASCLKPEQVRNQEILEATCEICFAAAGQKHGLATRELRKLSQEQMESLYAIADKNTQENRPEFYEN